MSVKSSDIAAIVDLFESSDWDELHIELDGLHLFLSTRPDAQLAGRSLSAVPLAAPASAAPALAAPASKAAAAAAPDAGPVPDNWVAVNAPNLGTFYRSPKPGAEPFVEIGQSVDADTEICLLEVMKLFTAVKAGVKGVVRRVCVQDADMVEFGQILFYIEKA